MAVLALGVVGSALGSAIGIGASTGWLGGVLIGNLLFGGGKGQNIEGPRLNDLSVQTSTYGSAIPLVYGAMRMSGNVIWSTPLKETRTVKKTSGGKGGGKKSSQTTYTYSASFAVGLCAGPVSTVRRIWADTKLIYDATASNTASTEKYPGVVRMHLGDETQEPDSVLEMHLGVGNTPAFRGLCYLVFSDLQLQDFANRIPNISAEVVASGGMQVDALILPPATGMFKDGGHIDRARGTLIGVGADNIYKYNLITNQLVLERDLADPNFPTYDLDGTYGNLSGIDSQGYYYHAADISSIYMRLVKRHPDTLAVVAVTNPRVPFSINGIVHRDKIFAYRSRLVYDTNLALIADLSTLFTTASEAPMCDDAEGRYWQAGAAKMRRASYDQLTGGGSVTEWDVALWTGGEVPRNVFWDDFTGHLYFTLGSAARIVKWHPDTGYAGHVNNVAIPAGFGLQSDTNLPLNGRLWSAASTTATLVDLVAMRLEKTIDLLPYAPTLSPHYGGAYEKFTHSVVIMSNAGQVKYPLERYGANTASLSDIFKDLCVRAGLSLTDLSTAAVTQAVRGYVVTRRMPAREALEPLLGTFFVDAVESDGVLKFQPRGEASPLSIPYDDLGATDEGGDAPIRVFETRTQDIELPRRFDIVYVDQDRDYQSNTQHATRIADAILTRERQTRDLPIALNADEAKRIAERTLYNAWVARNQYKFTLPPKWLRLDPTDAVMLTTLDGSMLLRLSKVDFGGNNLISCEAVAEDPEVYQSTASGIAPPLLSPPIALTGPIGLFLLDLPMLRLEDDTIGMNYAFAMRDQTGAASLYRSPDELIWDVLGVGDDGPVFGWAATILPATTKLWVWDEVSKVQIALAQGSLDSKTALEVLNGANAAILGDEIIQWKTATLLPGGTYELSGLLRGRRGTESAVSTHKLGERFVVLAADGFYRVSLPQTEIGRTAYYRAIQNGGEWDDAPTIPFSFAARSLKCLSPVKIKGSRDGSGNLTLTWVRRTRWYGEWQDGIDVPLFETSEKYEIDILSGTTVKRTLSTAAPSIVYSAAEQTADFGAPQSAISVVIYQINAVIGRGLPGQATL